MNMHQMAIMNGNKEITFPHPHWQWPGKSDDECHALVEYMKYGKYNKKGYPEIVETFEKNFANYHGVRHALTTNSGTSALHTAFFAVGVKPGDEVLAPTFTFHATASPLKQLGAVPVLCDCTPDTATIDPNEIENKITEKTKAIVITHLWGHPCEMDEICAIAKRNNLFLIEDCSHAHGAVYNGKKVGTFGDIGCFSLDNKKMMAAGEAGILITNKREYFERALLFSDFGPRLEFELTSPELKKFATTGVGNKYRVNPFAAVIANEKLSNLDKLVQLRKDKLDYLSKGIENLPGISPPVTKQNVTRGAFFGYKPFFHSNELNNIPLETFIEALQAEGMDIRKTVSPPLHLLPYFSESHGLASCQSQDAPDLAKKYQMGDFPVSENFIESTFSLPTFTFEPYELLDQYISAFAKVTNYFLHHDAIN